MVVLIMQFSMEYLGNKDQSHSGNLSLTCFNIDVKLGPFTLLAFSLFEACIALLATFTWS